MPFDPLPQADQHAFKLARRTTDMQRELVPYLVKARDEIEDAILKAARNKRFATAAKLRDGLYRDLGALYVKLNGNLDGWARRSIRGTAKEWRELGIDDIKAAGETPQGGSWTQFNKRHVDEYFARYNVFNADNLAATQTKTAPQLVRMAESDIRQLRQAVVEVNREAALTGITARERGKLLQERFSQLIGKGLDSWQFIDKSGKRWKSGSYFGMLNRTVAAGVARDAYHDQLAEGGRDTVQIIGSDPGVNPGCTAWVGTIVSLTGATKGIPHIDQARADNVFHPNCCTGDSLVYCPQIKAAHRFEYSGPMCKVELASGKNLTVTPNHMLLTGRGFIEAHKLTSADYVINCPDAEWVTKHGPNVDGKPTTIQDVFMAALESCSMSATSMPVTAEHFHGDGVFGKGNVDVINVNRLLLDDVCGGQTVRKFVEQEYLFFRDTNLPPFSGVGALSKLLLAAGLATNRIVSSARDFASILRTSLNEADLETFCLRSDFNSILGEQSPNDARTYAERIGQVVVTFSGMISRDYVVSVVEYDFSGHVYDLHSLSTLYYLNGILSSNCVHTTVYVSPLANPELITAQREQGAPEVEWRKGEKRKGGAGRPQAAKVSTAKDKTTAQAAKDVKAQEKLDQD